MSYDLVIEAPRAIIDGREAAAVVGIRAGRIAAIARQGEKLEAAERMSLGADVVLMPGLVDTHVHVSEPGTDWEGFDSATRAAAAGGITTFVDMPLDSVPTTINLAALDAKREAASGQCHVDVGFWGGAIPGNLSDMEPMAEAGVLGFKSFMVDFGGPHFPHVNPKQMEEALAQAGRLGLPLLLHSESQEVAAVMPPVRGRQYSGYLRARPRGMENLAVAQVIEAARRTKGHAHVVHLSSSDAETMIASARREGVPITTETCPHYLTVAAEDIAEGDTLFKCSPPIRERANIESLWRGLAAGTIDMVVSDHSPCTVEMKHLDTGDFGEAWGGISSLQLGLPLVWTYGRPRGLTLTAIATWMSAAPARLAGLGHKGAIAVGKDADFCVFAPDETFVVDNQRLLHRHPVSPYGGRALSGVVRTTLLRGRVVDFEHAQGVLLGPDR